jgi:hypothetical protein
MGRTLRVNGVDGLPLLARVSSSKKGANGFCFLLATAYHSIFTPFSHCITETDESLEIFTVRGRYQTGILKEKTENDKHQLADFAIRVGHGTAVVAPFPHHH